MMNGSAQRKCPSWIESFVEWSEPHGSPKIFRQWAAIATIGAIMEQRVFFITRSRPLFPNMYVFLVGPPGVGKSIAISSIAGLVRRIHDLNIAPISLTGASLVDAMAGARRIRNGGLQGQEIYNSLFLMPDDLQALLSKYDAELVANMTVFYDNIPYSQARRALGPEPIKIDSPQLSILGGTTNSHLMNLLPASAWEQGFMSRTIMVFSQDRQVVDPFMEQPKASDKDLSHDLETIFGLQGQFAAGDDFRDAYRRWQKAGFSPAPDHPRLEFYCSRREAHLLKLALISNVDRGDSLKLDVHDFVRARGWLELAEKAMPGVFAGPATLDSRAMTEIAHIIGAAWVPESKLVRLTAERIPAHSVKRTIDLMVDSGMLESRADVNSKKWYRKGPDPSS